MKKLAFEQIEDINVVRPYLFAFLIEEDETYKVGNFSQFLYMQDGQVFKMGRGHPFLQIAVGNDTELSFTFYPTEEPVSLNVKHWQHILETARDFLPEALASGDS